MFYNTAIDMLRLRALEERTQKTSGNALRQCTRIQNVPTEAAKRRGRKPPVPTAEGRQGMEEIDF